MFKLIADKVSAVFSQYKPYFVVGALASAFLAGGWTAWRVQDGRHARLAADLATCKQAQQSTAETLDRVARDARADRQACENRLAVQRRTADRLRAIDGLPRGGGKPDEQNGVVSDLAADRNSGGGDTVLDALNGLFGGR